MKVCQFQRVSLSSDQRANKFMIKANFWFNLNSWDPLICCTAGTRFIQLLAGFPFNRTDNIGDDIFVLLVVILAMIYFCFWWQPCLKSAFIDWQRLKHMWWQAHAKASFISSSSSWPSSSNLLLIFLASNICLLQTHVLLNLWLALD